MPSAYESRARPVYGLFGWAYDLVFTTPVEPWIETACQDLLSIGIGPGAAVLDAGCATGRYAAALSTYGYDVDLVDASADLLSQAVERLPDAEAVLADLCTLNLGRRYDAIVCRGVLNDMITDAERQAVLDRFALHVRPGGAVVLDVRDRTESERRYGRHRRIRREVDTPHGTLVFSADGRFHDGLIHVHERHELQIGRRSPPQVASHDFIMRPWTCAELRRRLRGAGFRVEKVTTSTDRGSADRLLCIAVRVAR